MRAFPCFRILLGLAGAAAIPCAAPARAADASVPVPLLSVSDDTPLVIANGVLRDYLVDGKPAPATLRNLVPIVQRHYPASNITMIGVDDIVVGDLVLQWAPKAPEPHAPLRPPPLFLVMRALSEASGRRFRVSDPTDPLTFLLLKSDDPGSLGPRVADVVYIGRLLSHGINKAGIENSLNELQTRMSVLDERYGEKSQEKERLSDLTTAMNQEKEHLSDEMAVLKKQLAQANFSDEEIDKLLAQISEVVTEALTKLQPDAKPPEFQFHRGTNLLVVIGSQSAVDITRKVVAALEQAQ
jgi:hypothetical protein